MTLQGQRRISAYPTGSKPHSINYNSTKLCKIKSRTKPIVTAQIVLWVTVICAVLSETNGFFTGGIINGFTKLTQVDSPYHIKENILIERNAQLLIEPGVTLYFRPRKGVTLHGTLVAEVRMLDRFNLI
jgi:hypothetical protein